MTDNEHATATAAMEPGHWYACRAELPDASYDATEVLEKSDALLPGNLRYALEDRAILVLGEVRDHYGELTLNDAKRRLYYAETEAPAFDADLRGEAACLFMESPYAWTPLEDRGQANPPANADEANMSRPEEPASGTGIPGADGSALPAQWSCVVSDSQVGSIELTARVMNDGVEVKANVGSVTDADIATAPDTFGAIARLLAHAHTCIRFARFAIRDNRVVAISFAAHDRIDVELPDSVGAVLAGVRHVRREVQALTDPRVASAYLAAMD